MTPARATSSSTAAPSRTTSPTRCTSSSSSPRSSPSSVRTASTSSPSCTVAARPARQAPCVSPSPVPSSRSPRTIAPPSRRAGFLTRDPRAVERKKYGLRRLVRHRSTRSADLSTSGEAGARLVLGPPRAPASCHGTCIRSTCSEEVMSWPCCSVPTSSGTGERGGDGIPRTTTRPCRRSGARRGRLVDHPPPGRGRTGPARERRDARSRDRGRTVLRRSRRPHGRCRPHPALAYLTDDYDAQLGVMISASHNAMHRQRHQVSSRPAATSWDDDQEDRIEALLDAPATGPVGAAIGRVRQAPDALARYESHLATIVKPDASTASPSSWTALTEPPRPPRRTPTAPRVRP